MKKILICILCLSMLFLSGCDMIRGIIPSDEPGVPDDIPKVDGRVSIESEDLYLFVNQTHKKREILLIIIKQKSAK